MLTCTLFLLNALKPVATVKEVNTCSCLAVGIILSYLPKVSKIGIPELSNGVHRILTNFSLSEKAPLIIVF